MQLRDSLACLQEMRHPVSLRRDIRSSLGPFGTMPTYVIEYPAVVIAALGQLYNEYNQAFSPLLALHREWDTDYRYAGTITTPVNWAVQIDMQGLTAEDLVSLASLPQAQVTELLRSRIFEIENSLAMYQLLERCFPQGSSPSRFSVRFRAALDELRRLHQRPIALLAVTQQKYEAMTESEFGCPPGSSPSPAEVSELSGFDAFFGPEDLKRHLADRHGGCDYLLYVRSSDPVGKLKKPAAQIDHPLLGCPDLRRVIREHAITYNVDDPSWPIGDTRRINDTKCYMPAMGMAHLVRCEEDVLTMDCLSHLRAAKPYLAFAGKRLADPLVEYLHKAGVDPEAIANGSQAIRAKPAQGTYGCYGHFRGTLDCKQFRSELRAGMRTRGPYVLQPELPQQMVPVDSVVYTYIDRVFFSCGESGPQFIGGFRNLLPMDSTDAAQGRVHGGHQAIWAEINQAQ